MTDPIFGSVSPPLWPAIPVPVYGYAQSPLASGYRFGTMAPGSAAQGAPVGPFSAGPTPNALVADPQAFGGIFGGPNFATGLSAVVSSPLANGVPAFVGAESAIGVTAPGSSQPSPCGAASHWARPTIRKSKTSSTTRSICSPGRAMLTCASKEGARYCWARSRTNGSSALSVNWPGRFPR